jgi:hypothetical protein
MDENDRASFPAPQSLIHSICRIAQYFIVKEKHMLKLADCEVDS